MITCNGRLLVYLASIRGQSIRGQIACVATGTILSGEHWFAQRVQQLQLIGRRRTTVHAVIITSNVRKFAQEPQATAIACVITLDSACEHKHLLSKWTQNPKQSAFPTVAYVNLRRNSVDDSELCQVRRDRPAIALVARSDLRAGKPSGVQRSPEL